MSRVRTAVLISGAGSNMDALIRAATAPDYPADIGLVLSNRPKAPGLQQAQKHGIPAICVDHTAYSSRAAFEAAVHGELVAHNIELVALAGFMRVLSRYFVEQWEGRMINIHPSLLPKYKGLHTHRRVLEAGDAEHGATVHWVTPELDSGEIILQARFSVPDQADVESLTAATRRVEHEIYPRALALAACTLRP